ncbi:hypothetical protein RI138_31730 [Streptomyces sp. C11-1]|uniref:Uncharacterized protein n=1 Tax=Streptomyces durocortorensis TaxID=2811104 RepID=A0ABY9WAF3_9ACTN|nr:hypothetical protein [Streptomyces durocortorensis]WNF31037.1 hypothetical protein RI138_31730 [Streptomyces durocortorensis]
MENTVTSELDERLPGRKWTVRLDPAGGGSPAVRVSCSRPVCATQQLPSATAGRAAAIAHLKAHLQAAPGPRPEAHCACKAEDCRLHTPPAGPRRAAPWRCGGPVVLAVITDRQSRWWQILECCARCAAAHPAAKVVATATAAAAPGRTTGTRTGPGRAADSAVTAPRFSDHSPPPADLPHGVPAPRSAPPRRRPRYGKIAQRIVPHDLHPVALRDELIELGDLFRAYQQRTEPDLAVLADLHSRKAKAFTIWADVTGDTRLRLDAQRAEQAAEAALLQHRFRTGHGGDGEEPAVKRLLTGTAQQHARSILDHVAAHSPLPGAQARLMVVMLTLRTVLTGTGNLVGQDVTSLPLEKPEDLIAQLVDCGWLRIPGTPEDVLASRPECPTQITIPSLMPGDDGEGLFTFGRKTRPKISGWAQKVVGDKKLRKRKTSAETRLLALALATRTTTDGQLGSDGQGLVLEDLASWCAVAPDELEALVEQLTNAQWLTDAEVTDTRLTGQLAERVLPLSCPLALPRNPAE